MWPAFLLANGIDRAKIREITVPASSYLPMLLSKQVEAVLDQAHLCPLPLQAKPVHWELDYTLRLAPLPHLLVLADHADQYAFDCKGGCQAVNPGSFSSDYSFVVYRPATQECEFSRVPS
jgi:DNA polymerase epsilon subunit 2